ncbi:Uncharacterised protein [Mycobacteroides abscessus subsp. abscessus]|nr:Uncharacterised protein [Mycobacteroides abscessus subsp. abscessus]
MTTAARRLLTAFVLFALTLVSGPALANAAPSAPTRSDVLTFSIPAIGGVETGPAGVPGGSLRPVTVVAQPAPRTLQFPPPPAAVTFSVPSPASYHYQYSYRFLSISWNNLRTGKHGVVSLRHWELPSYPVSGYPSTLKTSAVAVTGSGPVVATVSVLREQPNAAPQVISVIPGVNAIQLP